MASNEKTRYKAIIADHTYTIIGQESKQHMDLVTKIVNEQLAEIKHLSPQTDTEQASVLLAINAISDQLKKQEYALKLEKQVADLKQKTIPNGNYRRRSTGCFEKEWTRRCRNS